MDWFWEHEIPLPCPIEQRRIVEILNEADRLRRLRRDADAKAARILPVLFLKMFGDPATNPRGHEEKPLRDVIATVEAGWSATSEGRRRQDHEFGVLKVSAVTSGRFLAEEHKAVIGIPETRTLICLKRGDLLFSRANTRELVAATCIVDEDHQKLFLSDKLWRITPREGVASTLFLKEFFWHDGVRDKFRSASSGSSGSMLNISQEAMLRTLVPIPAYELQMKFEAVAWRFIEITNQTRNAASIIDLFWETLMQLTFSGQLTAKWREAHSKELLAEMEQQARLLNLPLPKEVELER
jgi:type I restriction enzyme S subunit